ncbi:MAG: hypothetical protein IV092_04170 [Burkholderiaceae bacterium]|nr:hypothetical protein [Burkholderiaceae bacterium]
MDPSGKDRDDSASEDGGQTASQRQMLSHLRFARTQGRRKLQVEQPQIQPTLQLQEEKKSADGLVRRPQLRREARIRVELPKLEAEAKPLLERAELLVNDGTIAPQLRQEFAEKSRNFRVARGTDDASQAKKSLVFQKIAALQLVNGKSAAEQKQAQVAGQKALFGDLAPMLSSVKKASFPVGQFEHIQALPAREKDMNKRDVALSQQFQSYLAVLETLENDKAAATDAKTLKGDCQALIAAADAYLTHFANVLDRQQRADETRLHEKRYCEEGRLSAMQYLIALDFEAIPDPKDLADGWSEKDQILAASVRAKINYHEAYQDAITLGDGGDASGASESRWLRGADWEAVAGAKPGDLRRGHDADGLAMPVNKRVAIFKTAIGEKAPDGMSDDQPGAGAIKEALACANAKLFARQTGIDLGVPETHVVSVNRYAIKGGGPTEKGKASGGSVEEVVGSSQDNAGAKDQLGELPRGVLKTVPAEDVHKMALLDIMSLNCDRHAGNIMVKFNDKNQPSLVPIDHGGSMPSRKDFDKVSGRIGGVDSRPGATGEVPTVMVVNELLTLPAAYEPFDPQMLAQLDLLNPAAMVDGMKAHRDAVDEVHAGLEAKDKVPDERFEMSRRSMMFMKLAAKARMSPAEIQIALGRRGGELFDVADDRFEALAAEVIEQFIPLKEGYKDLFTAPRDQVSVLAKWLADNGWTLPDATGKPSAEQFLMTHPVKAWRLFDTGTPNKNPVKAAAVPEPVAPKDDDLPVPDEAVKALVIQAFPSIKVAVEPKIWARRLYYWAELKTLGGEQRYQTILLGLKAQGVTADQSPVGALKTVQLWQELQKDDRRQALTNLPAANGAVASQFLAEVLGADNKNRALKALEDQLTNADDAIDDDEVLVGSIKRMLSEVAQWLSGRRRVPGLKAFQIRADEVSQALGPSPPSAVLAAAKALHGEVYDAMLDTVADEARATVAAFQQQVSNPSIVRYADRMLGNVIDSCYNAKSLFLGEKTLNKLERLDELVPVERLIAQARQEADLLRGQIKSKDVLALLEVRLQYLITIGNVDVPTLHEAKLALARLAATADIAALWAEVEETADGLRRGLPATMRGDIDVALSQVRAELLVNGQIDKGTQAFEAMKAQGDLLKQEVNQMPRFSWENTSMAKKAAISGRFISDKDTGISSAVEKPLKAKKEFLAALGKGAAWQEAGQRAVTAYEAFENFANVTLRGLESPNPPSRAWQAYCDSAVSACAKEIADIKDQMASRL